MKYTESNSADHTILAVPFKVHILCKISYVVTVYDGTWGHKSTSNISQHLYSVWKKSVLKVKIEFNKGE